MSAPAAPVHHSASRIFAASGVVSLLAIIVAYFYGGWKAAGLTLILGILEITLSGLPATSRC